MTPPEYNNKPGNGSALALLTSLFFMWGFITSLNDILIPHLKSAFTLNYAQAMLVQFCFFAAYFVVSVPSGWLVARWGYQKGLVTGLLLAGVGCLLFYPAAGFRSYALFLSAFFVLASGITLLQVAANPYVTALGSPKTASSRLTMTQAFNSLGTTIGPYLGTLLILSVAVKSAAELQSYGAEQLIQYQILQAQAVQQPYLMLMAILLALAAVFASIRLPVIKPAQLEQEMDTAGAGEGMPVHAWHYRHLRLGAAAIFVYVGAEVAIGSFLINFMGDAAIAGLPPQTAGQYVSLYWGGAMVGRFVGAAVMQHVAANKALSINALVALGLLILTMVGQGQTAMWTILAVGLFNSIMFPTIFSLAISGLGPHTGQGSGILCAAIVGGAVIPLIQGIVADKIGIQPAFFLPALCYGYIAYYGLQGYKPK